MYLFIDSRIKSMLRLFTGVQQEKTLLLKTSINFRILFSLIFSDIERWTVLWGNLTCMVSTNHEKIILSAFLAILAFSKTEKIFWLLLKERLKILRLLLKLQLNNLNLNVWNLLIIHAWKKQTKRNMLKKLPFWLGFLRVEIG